MGLPCSFVTGFGWHGCVLRSSLVLRSVTLFALAFSIAHALFTEIHDEKAGSGLAAFHCLWPYTARKSLAVGFH